ncbi:MAG: hypothetical protein ACREHC_01400 [Candidatus Levyibacteriota bacterium]
MIFKNDPIMQRLVDMYPAPQFVDESNELMQSLVKSNISQQLSVKAAATILGRFKDLFGSTSCPSAKEMIKLSEKWKPYRSTACWYLWRSLGNSPLS